MPSGTYMVWGRSRVRTLMFLMPRATSCFEADGSETTSKAAWAVSLEEEGKGTWFLLLVSMRGLLS